MTSRCAERITCRPALGDREIVTNDQMKLFCSIVQFQPGEGRDNYDLRHAYITRTAPLVKKLQFPLCRPNPALRKALLPKQSEYTHLCDMHRGLNADFVHQWFTLLALEVGLRMNSLIAAGRTKIGELLWENPLMHLRQLHRIWLGDEQIRDTFGTSLYRHHSTSTSGLSLHRQGDGCEACILSRVGSHLQTILALRCVAHSRLGSTHFSRHLYRMRLERLLTGWLMAWQTFAGYNSRQKFEYESTLKRNSEMAKALREKRKEFRKQRHQKYDETNNLIQVSSNSNSYYTDKSDEVEDDSILQMVRDAENDIIDTYAALRTTCYFPNSTAQSSAVYFDQGSASRKELSSIPIFLGASPSTDFLYDQNQLESCYHNLPSEAYNESIYSVDTIRNNTRVLETSSAFPKSLRTKSLAASRNPSAVPRLYNSEEETRQSKRDEISPTRKSHHAKALQMLELGDQLPPTRYSPMRKKESFGKRVQDVKLCRDHTTDCSNFKDSIYGKGRERLASDTTTFRLLLSLDEEASDCRQNCNDNHYGIC